MERSEEHTLLDEKPETMIKHLTAKADDETQDETAKTSVWRPRKPSKRPSWLQVNEPRSADLSAEQPEVEKAEALAKTPAPKPGSPAEPAKAEGDLMPSPALAALGTLAGAAALESRSETTTEAESEDTLKAKRDTMAETAPTPEPQEADHAAALFARDTDGAKTEPASGAELLPKKMTALQMYLATHSRRAQRPNAALNHEPLPESEAEEEPRAEEQPEKWAKEPMREEHDTRDKEAGPDLVARSLSATDFIRRLREEARRESAAHDEAADRKGGLGGLLDRIRGNEAKEEKQRETTSSLTSLVSRKAKKAEKKAKAAEEAEDRDVEGGALSPNDLRHYLTQRMAGSDLDETADILAKPRVGMGEVGPVLRTLDDVLNTILESITGRLPRTMLVAGTSVRAESSKAAIAVGRSLVGRNEQVALVDLAKGTPGVSGVLGMPRVPGYSDLAAGRVDFIDVVRLDDESPLQVITAGNPIRNGAEHEADHFSRLFEALTQAYDCVVLHADLEAMDTLMPALKFELLAAVAVLPNPGSLESERQPLLTFQRLGCSVVVYEASCKPRRTSGGFFWRKAAAT